MHIQKKDIMVQILLSIVTCGFYSIYWFITVVNDTNAICHREGEMSGALVFLLSLITCGIYGCVWMYQAGAAIDEERLRRGLTHDSRALTYLLLEIFGLALVSVALLQSELNNFIDLDTRTI